MEFYFFLKIFHLFLKYDQKSKITEKDRKFTRNVWFISSTPAAGKFLFFTGYVYSLFVKIQAKTVNYRKRPNIVK